MCVKNSNKTKKLRTQTHINRMAWQTFNLTTLTISALAVNLHAEHCFQK
jgi:hypothetical protein